MSARMDLRAVLVAAMVSMAATVSAAAQAPGEGQDLRSRNPVNAFAFIPPQCYTKTRTKGEVHNPCYTCHIRPVVPNYVNDGDLQTLYDFPDPALGNPWTNMFLDRRPAIAALPDDAILAYVRTDNYRNEKGEPELAARLAHPPAGWDINGDGHWSGYVPDIHFTFDTEGYDVGPDGTRTGWRAYGYLPLPG